jgi:hypothetical protein
VSSELYRGFFGMLILGVACTATSAADGENAPFNARNLNPFILIHGLPPTTSAELLADGETSLQFHLDIANHSKASAKEFESIRLDGETYRTSIIWKRGLSGGWQVGAELPLISHSSGVMDQPILSWHNLLGITNEDREPGPRNRLLFSYWHAGGTEIELSDGSSGVGDIQLLASRSIWSSPDGNLLTLHTSLKLPTGDADRLQGSGAADLALWVSGDMPSLRQSWPIGGFMQAGLLVMGDADVLSELQRDVAWFGGVGTYWQALPWLTLKGQIDAHSAIYRSDLDQLGRSSYLLTLGGTIRLEQNRAVVDLAFGENLFDDAVPDFMINLAYRHRF